MPEISPSRILAFAAMAGVLALIGWNSLRSGGATDRGAIAGPAPGHSATGSADGTGPKGEGSGEAGGLKPAAGGRRIVVDVSGAVRRPGVYRFEHGQRVIDAIRRAGGASPGAFSAGINRAALLADGQQVVVPARTVDVSAPGTGAGEAPGAASEDAPISLGTATQEQLEQIEGIGPVTAQSILEFRDSEGGVSSVDELDQVSGIGPVTMEALRSRLQP